MLPVAVGLLALVSWRPQRLFDPPSYGYQLLGTFPHDRSAFTQGLYFEEEGTLLESTGLYGESTLRRVELSTGKVLQRTDLPSDCFGEGMTVAGGRCFQLTYREGNKSDPQYV